MEKFKENVEKLGIELTEKKEKQFENYYSLLVEWNEFMNLTAITEKNEVYLKHFLDSLAILVTDIDLSKNLKLLDIGTGAGFPGIPLKIAFENLDVTLLDSLNKRIKFLDEVINKIELKDIKAIHARAEDFAKNAEFRENFDICVSRAVANLATLSEYCVPYVKEGGYFIAYKSGEIDEELETSKKAIEILGGKIENVVKFNLADSDIERSFVIIKKVKNTPKKYPRKAGLPSKEPIK